MLRRDFLHASVASAGVAALASPAMAQDAPAGKREFFEIRSYTLKSGKRPLMDAYLKDALVPALNRAGVKPVGVFYENPEGIGPTAVVLVRYKSLAEYA